MNALVKQDLERALVRLEEPLQRLSGQTLYITGGGGFLGMYLTLIPLFWNENHPTQKPIKVVSADIFKLGRPRWIDEVKGSAFTALTFDTNTGLPKDLNPDYVFHGSSFASPIVYRQYPIETIYGNIWGLSHILEHARKNQVKSVAYFSSSEIYGDPPAEEIPTKETYRGNVSCTGPRACYDEAKRLCEALCTSYFFQHQVAVKLIRPFNNYGPGLRLNDGRVLADFVRTSLTDGKIVLLSDGSPMRTFCYVLDAVVGYFQVLLSGRPGEPYNIGTAKPEISMREVADLVAATATKLGRRKVQVSFANSSDAHYLTDNPQRRCPDLTKAKTDFGYEAEVAVEDGIARYFQWGMEQSLDV